MGYLAALLFPCVLPAAPAGSLPVAYWNLRDSVDDVQMPASKLVRTVGSPEKTRGGFLFHGDQAEGLLYGRGAGDELCPNGSFSIWARAAFGAAMPRLLANQDTLVSRWGPRGAYSFIFKADAYTDTLHLCVSGDGKGYAVYDSGYRIDRGGGMHDLAVVVRAGEDVTFYIDGRRRCVLRTPLPPKKCFNPPEDTVPFAIGYNHDVAPAGDHEPMNGTIAAIRFWQSAASPEMIARLSGLSLKDAERTAWSVEVDATKPIGKVHPYVFGLALEHFQNVVYGGIVSETSKHADKQGFRTDVVDALKRLQPTVVRWPGGNFASAYQWRLGAGPRQDRKAIAEGPMWKEPEPNTFGTSEFIALCRRLGADPYICVGVGRSPENPTAEDAAAWVRYCNAKEGPEADTRRAAGFPEPFEVTLWGLGNEVYGSWAPGRYRDAVQYAADLVRYAHAMRAADPRLRFVVVGFRGDFTYWNAAVLTDDVVRTADWISYHSYTDLGSRGPRVSPEVVSQRLAQIDRDVDANRRVNIAACQRAGRNEALTTAVDEWNEFGGGPPADNERLEYYDLANALFTAGHFNSLIRHADEVTLACYAPAVNGRGLVWADERGLILRPTYHVFELYRSSAGGESLPVKAEVPALDGSSAPVLDVAAVRDRAGNVLMYVVNRDARHSVDCRFTLKGFTARGVRGRVLTGSSLAAFNSFERPEDVVARDTDVEASGGAFAVTLAPRSVTLLRLSK